MIKLFKRKELQTENGEPARNELSEDITPPEENNDNKNLADIPPIAGEPRNPTTRYEEKFLFGKMFRDREFPHRFEQIFSTTKVSFHPYRARPRDTLHYTARELLIKVVPLREESETHVFEAIRQVLESDEIKQYGQYSPPDFDRPYITGVYNFVLKVNPDFDQSVAIAKLVERRLLEKLERDYPTNFSDPYVKEEVKDGFYTPKRISEVDTSILTPYYPLNDIYIPFKAKNGRRFSLREFQREDLSFLSRLAYSSTPDGRSYVEYGDDPFVFSVLNAQLHEGPSRKIDLSPCPDKHGIKKVYQELMALYDIENLKRRNNQKPPFNSVEEFVRAEYDLKLQNNFLTLEEGKKIPIALCVYNYLRDAFNTHGETRDPPILAIEDESGRPVGAIELLSIEQVFGKGSGHEAKKGEMGLGYFIAPELKGYGLATKGSIAMLQFAKERLGLKTLYSGADPDNLGSLHVLFSLGLRPIRGEEGKIKLLSKEETIYTDAEGNPRPRVEMKVDEDRLTEILNHPEQLDNPEYKARMKSEFQDFIKELQQQMRTLGWETGKGAHLGPHTRKALEERRSAGVSHNP